MRRYSLTLQTKVAVKMASRVDIDIDWQDDRREEGIEYVKQKYGEQSVCQIITFNNLMAKAVVRAVARVLEYPVAMQDKIAKLIPAKPGIALDAVFEEIQEFKQLYEENADVKKIVDIAKRLEGVTTSVGTHAAGVLITDSTGVTAHVPVWKIDDRIVTQYDKDLLEELGLLKMDFLGLSNLTIISDAIKNIKDNHGIDINLYELYQAKDTKPFEIIQKGYTQGIFQLESDGMTEFMKELKPDNLDDLTAGVALYRPGPMQYIPTFIRNKRNPKLVTYMFPELEPILKSTYGLLVYQEQCMQTVIAIGGYQKHHSDSFRKAIGKKVRELIKTHRGWFIDGRPEIVDDDGNVTQDAIPGALKLGFDEKKVNQLYDEMEEFGKYSFNKSHAACYAVIAYVTAWLKYYYPAEFMAALIDKQKSSKGKDAYIKIAKYSRHAKDDLGVQVKLPSVLYSGKKVYAIDENTIAESLHSKGVDDVSMQKLIEIRETQGLNSMTDFYRNCGGINKKAIESWICIGAFDEFGITRSQHLCIVDTVKKKLSLIKAAQDRYEKSTSKCKVKPAGFDEKVNIDELLPDIQEIPNEIKYNLEKIYSGSFLTGHPLDRYQSIINKLNAAPISILDYEVDEETGELKTINPNVQNGQSITCVCVISEIYKTQTRKNKEAMAILTLEDKTGVTKGLLFPESYERYKNEIDTLNVFKVEGKIKMEQDEEPVIFISSIEKLKQTVQERIVFHCDKPSDTLEVLKHLANFKGAGKNYTPVYIECGNLKVLLKNELWVDLEIFKRFPQPLPVEIVEW